MITVYSKNQCPYCTQAKALLEQKGIAYTEVKIDEKPEAREFVVGRGHRTVPQLYVGDQLLVEGGFTGLKSLSDEELNQRLEQYASLLK